MNSFTPDSAPSDTGRLTARPVSAVVISRNDIFIAGIRTLLRENLRLGAVHSFAGTDAFILEHASIGEHPDLVIIDEGAHAGTNMPYGWITGLAGFSRAEVVLMTAAGGSVSLADIIGRGVRACVEKSQPTARIMQAVKAALSHEWWVSEECRLVVKTDANREGGISIAQRLFDDLTHAEKSVMRKLMNGMTVTGIAERHGRSIKTISGQKMSAMRKLNVKDMVELHRVLGNISR